MFDLDILLTSQTTPLNKSGFFPSCSFVNFVNLNDNEPTEAPGTWLSVIRCHITCRYPQYFNEVFVWLISFKYTNPNLVHFLRNIIWECFRDFVGGYLSPKTYSISISRAAHNISKCLLWERTFQIKSDLKLQLGYWFWLPINFVTSLLLLLEEISICLLQINRTAIFRTNTCIVPLMWQ